MVGILCTVRRPNHLVAHKHILEICRLNDNLRDGEENRCGPSNLKLNVHNETLNKVFQNIISSLIDFRFVMSACTLFAKGDIVATQHVLGVSLRKLWSPDTSAGGP
jgi:hypothetical protein